ncbi:ABC transporter ATP-binding protein [Alkalihalobacillus sp. BA299]|uniref:ABC transporter ATP-binding protein n=1 Tax=Alkalihalobacillus sp. BA299 TaxID=2815938 RepID=UPI001ADCD364|nr:ABC transporter ATP-binding protein [Alkalihalobacillus sp. BA299]
MTRMIDCQQVKMQFKGNLDPILTNINLQVQEGDFVSIIGKSGSGKTTLLQMIGGLLEPTAGEVKVNGTLIQEPIDEITYVFQKPVLLEWRNILENVLMPLELKRRLTKTDIEQAREVINIVGLASHENKYPHELSGGMMSRVTLARALLSQPKVLLMDEPFSALDAMTKEQLQIELMELSNRFSTTVLFITHDITEAVYLSDRVVLLGDQPAQVINEFSIPFPRPRPKELKFDVAFTKIIKEIHEQVEVNGGAT